MKSIVNLVSIVFVLNLIHAEDVDLSYRGGVYHTPITLNNAVRLDFIVDTGAAQVFMPADVFRTLLRTGTIKKTDILGEEKYETASGQVTSNLVVNLREVKIGDQIINNVEAAIGNIESSLLLGQSALRKLEPWSLNTGQKVLSIKSIESKNSVNTSPLKDVQPESIAKDEVISFLDQYISRGNSGDIEGVMNLYADRVDYFNAGIVSKYFIFQDKIDYYKRWPSVQSSLVSIDSIQNVPRAKNIKQVIYTIDFDVYNYDTKKGIVGQATNIVMIKKEDGKLKIVSDKQKVFTRKKY